MAIVSSNPAINKLTGDTALSEPHAFTSETGYPVVGSEERVGGIDVSAKVKNLMNKLLQSTSSTKSAAIKSLLNSKIHPNELLGAIRVNGDITKLDDNPELLQWFQFAAAYRKKNGDQALPDLEIYFMLVRQYQVNEVTSLIQALTKTPGLKKLGTSMENSLSGSWISKALKRKTDPTVLFNTLHLKAAGAKLDEVPVFHQWLKYVDSYRTMMGFARFTNSEMLELFQKSMPEEDLVALLHRLRQTPGMTEHADTMQRMLFELSKSSHQLMLNMWLKAQESPENVYKILRLGKVEMDGFGDNAMAIQWLRYTKLFRDQTPSHAFSDVQTVKFLHEERPLQSDWKLATFFQTSRRPPT